MNPTDTIELAANDLLAKLKAACTGGMSALRVVVSLQPTGGNLDKVFPPTYNGEDEKGKPKAQYATERRLLDGEQVETVLLDSVQSQANRLEEVLLRAFDANQCDMPLMMVEIENHGRITALDAPHRISDAIFRDSNLDGKSFVETEKGKRVKDARTHNATAFYEMCPTALIFGTWDSHTRGGVHSAKIPRAFTSEIIGLRALPGKRTSSRIDPLGIQRGVKIYHHKNRAEMWTSNENEADRYSLEKDGEKGKDGKLKLPSGKKEGDLKVFKDGKPSEIGHSNIPPTISTVGGASISEAVQTSVLSFVQLRRLSFPNNGNKNTPERDVAGRTVLAALALYALALQLDEGYQLRSRCQLSPLEEPRFEFIGRTLNDIEPFAIKPEAAKQAFDLARENAAQVGLPFKREEIVFTPSPKLTELVRLSDNIKEDVEGEDDGAKGGES